MILGEYLQMIRGLVESDLGGALSELKKISGILNGFANFATLQSSVLTISGAYHDLVQQERDLVLRPAEITTQKARIRVSTLSIIDEIENSLGENESLKQQIITKLKSFLESDHRDLSQEIKSLIGEIDQRIADFSSKEEDSPMPMGPFLKDEFHKNKEEQELLEDLIGAVEFGNCILFLGPEISVGEDGEVLHHKFYKRISNSSRLYFEEENLFMPGSEMRIRNYAQKYYREDFKKENTIAYCVLRKLANIPFKLVISLTPDTTLHDIYDEFLIPSRCLYFDGTHRCILKEGRGEQLEDEEFKLEEGIPVIYNALGAASVNGRYLYTHKQLNDYLKKESGAKFPTEIEDLIKSGEATHFLFLGFDFNKWPYKLLMYELNLLPGADGIALDASKVRKMNKEFISKQFNITFINKNYTQFADILSYAYGRRKETDTLELRLLETIKSRVLRIQLDLGISPKPNSLRKWRIEFEELRQRYASTLSNICENE